MKHLIEVIPNGYTLQALDECGVAERQPHVRQKNFRLFNQHEVDANQRERMVTWDHQAVTAVFDGVRDDVDWVLAVRYTTGPTPRRVQSLWAGKVQLHGPRVLHAGFAERFILNVPREAVRGGKLELEFRREGEGEAMLGAVELWAPLPSVRALRFLQVESLYSDLRGQVTDLAFGAVAGARVELSGKAGAAASATTGPDGRFCFSRDILHGFAVKGEVRITASWQGSVGTLVLQPADIQFAPVRYPPVPDAVEGIASHRLDLCGDWKIDPRADDTTVGKDLSGWQAFHVPGQFAQQGFELADDQIVAVAREFVVPKEWKGHRVFLRFDSIHGGVRYWVNGKSLGSSENLFTPVDREITEVARFGENNRLDMLMKLATTSERLSFASGYAFHPLGGIDRAVHLFAVPLVGVTGLRVAADYDTARNEGSIDLSLTVDNRSGAAAADLSLSLDLASSSGQQVKLSESGKKLAVPAGGQTVVSLRAVVASPKPWSAEKPHLYKLTMTLESGARTLERVERSVGFRRVEIRGSELFLNGKSIKLAGACHHELYPLTGRADTMQWAERDILMLKGASLNYLRTSHYPPPQELLDAADRHGVYVECEAPLCWVGERDQDVALAEVLTPTSAMIDYHHAHPSILLWSLANESQFKEYFKVSHRLCRELDPTRPTTFNNPDPEQVCEIANLHYPPMPYDEQLKGDPRPILLGEYFFPLCHEQTDMRINPGLRELWGHGHAQPDSDWSKKCARSFDGSFLHPGALPGTWTHIVRSRRVIGGAIWALIDEPYYLPKGGKAGYAWVHGFWGLIDGWRRPKPEYWMSKLIFSPVWFPSRSVEYTPGQDVVRVPVENRYAFTDLGELDLRWTIAGAAGGKGSAAGTAGGEGAVKAAVPPGGSGEIEIRVPKGTAEGSRLLLKALDAAGGIVSAAVITLGRERPRSLPRPGNGCPTWTDRDGVITVQGKGFSLAIDRATLRCVTNAAGRPGAIAAFPIVHLTRIDIADLVYPRAAPYAVLPDPETRRIEEVRVEETPSGLEITVRDTFEGCSGTVSWVIDSLGMGRVRYRYVRSGGGVLGVREVGVRFAMATDCDRLSWKRWSEWGELPDDHIGRTEGTASARRPADLGPGQEDRLPAWPWMLDQNEYGTNDFRGVKFTIHEASLTGPSGGLRVHANADVHVRSCIDPRTNGILMHLLSECRLGQIKLAAGDVVSGEFIVEVLPS
jgi:beta-galactosidase